MLTNSLCLRYICQLLPQSMRMTGNQVRYLIALVLMLALVTLSGYYDGPAAVAAVGTLVLLFPLGAWLILFRARPAEQTLRVYDMLRRRWDWGYYFEATVVTAPSIEPKFLVERRFIELLFPAPFVLPLPYCSSSDRSAIS